MKKSNKYLFLLILGLLFSCGKKVVQFPANKGNTVDSTEINLRTINETLIQKEDSLLADFVKTTSLKKAPSGIWYFKEVVTNADSLKKYPTVTFSYVLSILKGKTIESGTKTIRFEKKEIPTGLEEGLKLMRKGEKMRLIVPWYLGYGMKGEGNIPPYTSLIYEIKVSQ